MFFFGSPPCLPYFFIGYLYRLFWNDTKKWKKKDPKKDGLGSSVTYIGEVPNNKIPRPNFQAALFYSQQKLFDMHTNTKDKS